MRKNGMVVQYPASVKKLFRKAEFYSSERLKRLLDECNFSPKVRFRAIGDPKMTTFAILLPNGLCFTGFAIKKPGDVEDQEGALMIAAGRAIAVWKHHKNTNWIGLDPTGWKDVSGYTLYRDGLPIAPGPICSIGEFIMNVPRSADRMTIVLPEGTKKITVIHS